MTQYVRLGTGRRGAFLDPTLLVGHAARSRLPPASTLCSRETDAISNEPKPWHLESAGDHVSAGPPMNDWTPLATSPWRSSRIAVIGVFSLKCGFPPMNH